MMDTLATVSNISSIFPNNSEAFASELLESIGDMLLRYYMPNDKLSKFNFSTTQ